MPRWLIVSLLPLTLAWKLAVGLEDPNELKNGIVDLLAQNHFDVLVTEETMDGMPIIRASSEACRMVIVKTPASGWTRHMISDLAATDRVFIVFRGRVYTEQPIWLTLVTHMWSSFIRKLGFARNTIPVIAVVATAACGAESVPWVELRERGVL